MKRFKSARRSVVFSLIKIEAKGRSTASLLYLVAFPFPPLFKRIIISFFLLSVFRVSFCRALPHFLIEVLPVAAIAASVWRVCLWNLYNRGCTKALQICRSETTFGIPGSLFIVAHTHKRETQSREVLLVRLRYHQSWRWSKPSN